MKKRALERVVYLNDEPVLLPEEIAKAIERAPRVPRRMSAAEYKAAHPVKAYANPNGPGYGGGETPWPFDTKRAYVDGRYRSGVRNAMNADWTAQNWKHAARAALQVVLENLLAAEDVIEDVEAEEERKAEQMVIDLTSYDDRMLYYSQRKQ